MTMTKSPPYTLVLLAAVVAAASAFVSPPLPRSSCLPQKSCSPSTKHSQLCASAVVDEIPSDAPLDTSTYEDGTSKDPESILQSRNRLLALSSTLAKNSPTGRFLSLTEDKRKFARAISQLEALANENLKKDMLVGDWILVATTSVPSSDIRRRFNSKKNSNTEGAKQTVKRKFGSSGRSGLSLFGRDGRTISPIQTSLRKSIEVTQRIRTMDESSGEIDRVDNVIEFTPYNSLDEMGILPKPDEGSPLESVVNLVKDLNLNPLGVEKSKVVLVHKAEVESEEPILRTKIAWVSSVLNVAGTSQFFEPEGSDILGTNNPLGEFLNVGSFDTLYVDEDVRVSRSNAGAAGSVLEQLRVFVKKRSDGSTILDSEEALLDSLVAEMRVEEEREVNTKSEGEKQFEKVTNASQSVQQSITNMNDSVRSAVEEDMDQVTSAVGEAMNDMVSRVQDVVEDDLQQISKAVEGVQEALSDEGRNITGVSEAIANATKIVGDTLTNAPSEVLQVLEEDLTEVSEAVEKALDDVVKDVQDVVEGDIPKIEESLRDVRKAATGSNEEDDFDEKNDDNKNESE